MALYPQLELDSLVHQLIAAPRLSFGDALHVQLPIDGGMYRICDVTYSPASEVYIGISENLERRIYRNHFHGTERNSTLTRKLINAGLYPNAAAVHAFLENSCEVQSIEIADKRLRCFAEHYAVAILQPLYND